MSCLLAAAAAAQVFGHATKEDFEREVAMLSKVGHPSIMAFYGVSTDPKGEPRGPNTPQKKICRISHFLYFLRIL